MNTEKKPVATVEQARVRFTVRRTRSGWRWLLAMAAACLPALLVAGAITGSLSRDVQAKFDPSQDPVDPCPTVLVTPCPVATELPSLPLPTISLPIGSSPTPSDPGTPAGTPTPDTTPLPTGIPTVAPTIVPTSLPTPTDLPILPPTPTPTIDPGSGATPTPAPTSSPAGNGGGPTGGGGNTGGGAGGSGGGHSGGGGGTSNGGGILNDFGGGGGGVSLDSSQPASGVLGLTTPGDLGLGTTPPITFPSGPPVPANPGQPAGAIGFPVATNPQGDSSAVLLVGALVLGVFLVLISSAVYVSRLK